jgi:hypothetical protein
MGKTDTPINVIILDDIEQKSECLLDAYVEIVALCKKKSEVRAAIAMLMAENRTLTIREVVIKRIQFDASILEETAKMK